MTAKDPRHTTIMLARYEGFASALRFAASIARQSGDRAWALKLSDLARSDITYRLANMDEVDAQVVYAAAVADCTPAPVKRRPCLVLVEGGR
jgi:hypothetical protein